MNLNPAAVPAILLTIPLFWVGMTLQRRTQSRVLRFVFALLGIIVAVPGFLLVAYYKHLFDSARWFVSVPFIKPVLDPIDLGELQDRCPGGVCLQITYSTCGPASSASLLQAFGQDASEQQLARESFTSKGGTGIWYLARAFRRRGFRTNFVIQSPDHIFPPSPSIAGLVLRSGQGHFIALLNDEAGRMTVVDPLKGKFVVTSEQLKAKYRFSGLFLVVRRG